MAEQDATLPHLVAFEVKATRPRLHVHHAGVGRLREGQDGEGRAHRAVFASGKRQDLDGVARLPSRLEDLLDLRPYYLDATC